MSIHVGPGLFLAPLVFPTILQVLNLLRKFAKKVVEGFFVMEFDITYSRGMCGCLVLNAKEEVVSLLLGELPWRKNILVIPACFLRQLYHTP